MSIAVKQVNVPSELRALASPVKRQWVSWPVIVALAGTTPTRSVLIPPGDYYIVATCDFYVLQGSSTVSATAASYKYAAWKEVGPLRIDSASDGYFSALPVQGASGNLHILPAQHQ